ncbi:hypothetical protein RclHR1_33220002 [Rhizophagus clarus]|uniref:Uncharacterized protein n=1 Tax=Rhizophagus clarus TaxID=94130 RepID=A0A2Z6S3B4_9GLOM|nr:hypothetical protein RclHR1_33220002 [Rhizophagus clarus]
MLVTFRFSSFFLGPELHFKADYYLKEVDRIISKAQNSNLKRIEVQTKSRLYSKIDEEHFEGLQFLDEFLNKILKAYNTVQTFFFNQNVDSFVVLRLRRLMASWMLTKNGEELKSEVYSFSDAF